MAFAALLDAGATADAVAPEQFHALRERAAEVVASSAAGDGAARELAFALVAVERHFLERVDELRRATIAEGGGADGAHAPDECSITKAQLTDYLRQRLASSPAVVVERLSVVPGGLSKETILVALSGTDELPGEIIVRKDRPVSLLGTRAADEFAVIKAVHDFGGVPVPEPFFAEGEDNALGAGTFLVMERVAGRKAGEFFPDLAAPTDHGPEIGRQIARALARLHSLPLDQFAATGLDPATAGVTEASIAAGVEGLVERIAGLTGPPCASVPLARQWLLDHVADVVPAPRLALLQGDFGFHNMLVDGDRLTALVDWEAAAIGPPARELAAAFNAIAALMPWPDFVAAYVDGGGSVSDTDPRAVDYYRVVSALGGFMASRMGGHMFRTGTKRDLLTAHSGLDAHFRCARNLARALEDAMSGLSPA
jgi:aminoglycoside phosphotransferase (APT) family kinase protein